MIIRIRKDGEAFVASVRAANMEGCGRNEAEAIGNLIIALASASDSVDATENIDVSVVSV